MIDKVQAILHVVCMELLSKLLGKDSCENLIKALCQQLASVLGHLLQAVGDVPVSATPS